MGISPLIANAIVREHKFKNFPGDIVTIGRQTFLFSPEKALAMCARESIDVSGIDPATLPLDTDTKFVKADRYIRDDAFFGLLGVKTVRSIDVSAYERADIIHDLNQPLPDHLCAIADVIIDGSTLDNVFNPAEALRNLSKMLRPGGRLISVNVGTNHYNPYLIITPGWLHDYFVVNEYADCRVYANIVRNDGAVLSIMIDPSRITKDTSTIWNVQTPHTIVLCVIAEKGQHSTSDRFPNQMHYQSPAEKEAYLKNLAPMIASKRPGHFDSTHMLEAACPEIYLAVNFDYSLAAVADNPKSAFRGILRRMKDVFG